MPYQVIIETRAKKSYLDFPEKIQDQIDVAIDDLSGNPRPPNCKKLRGTQAGYRIRSGNYRILYTINDRQRVVIVFKMGHRSTVYR